jgi:choline transport protein
MEDPRDNKRRLQADIDAQDLAALGHSQTLARKFSLWSILALSFCVLGTW